MIDVIAERRRALATARGLTEKAGLCEHTLSLMSDSDHLAFDKAA